MRIVVQRVSQASVVIDQKEHARISKGLLALLGIEDADSLEDVEWLVKKLVALRIFDDGEGKMNLALQDIHGEIMVISQFTLHASTHKGNRPSFIKAARPEKAIPLYNSFVQTLETHIGSKVATGVFAANMQVALINDGPVTIIIDSKLRE